MNIDVKLISRHTENFWWATPHAHPPMNGSLKKYQNSKHFIF